MNLDQIKYLISFLRSKINTGDRMRYKFYSITYNDLSFNFEAVGIYTTNLICDNRVMSYRFEDSFASCSCRIKDCIHKKELKNLMNTILDGKDL